MRFFSGAPVAASTCCVSGAPGFGVDGDTLDGDTSGLDRFALVAHIMERVNLQVLQVLREFAPACFLH